MRWKPILLVNVFRKSVVSYGLLDQLNMIAFSFLLVIVLYSLQVHGHVVHTVQIAKNHNELMNQLKHNSDILEREKVQLKNNQSQLKAYLAQHKANCTTELKMIEDKDEETLRKGGAHVSTMHDLLSALQKEEQVHVQLTEELKKLSTVLELFQIQYIVIDGDLKLSSARRHNGTLDRCNEVSIALKDELIKIRSGFIRNPLTLTRTLSAEELARMMEEGKVRDKSRINKNLAIQLTELIEKLEKQKQSCLQTKQDKNIVLQEVIKFQVTAQNSKIYLEKLLSEAVEHSKAIRLELTTGRKFVRQLTEKVSKKKNSIVQYKDDSACYKAIEESV